ncbi:MAG: transcriptional regulator [Alphaproteobacteria bacterium]
MKTVKPVAASIKKWMKEPKFRAAYDALEPEYALAGAMIEARAKSGLSQAQLARRTGRVRPEIVQERAGKPFAVPHIREQKPRNSEDKPVIE